MSTSNTLITAPDLDAQAIGAWAMRALAAVGKICTARDASECLAHFFDATHTMGFTAGLYAVLIPEAGGEVSSITLFACDPAFAQGFDPGADLMHPWLRYARRHTTAIQGEDLFRREPDDTGAFAFAQQHGFGQCLLVPIAAGAELGRTELLCLGVDEGATSHLNETRPLKALAHALAGELHAWFTTKLQASLLEDARLRPQDIQVLACEWQGLSSKEIAQRTGMSVAAVDSRFQRLNLRLRCDNRRAAARRAAEYGLLQSASPCTAPVLPAGLMTGDAVARALPLGPESPPLRRSAAQPWR